MATGDVAKEQGKTRREILNVLKRQGGMTADALAAHLSITNVAVRRHLAVLEAAGVVAYQIEKRAKGRPAQIYTLTDESDDLFPKNYDRLAATLLEQVVAMDGIEKVQALFGARRRQLEAANADRVAGKTLRERVAAVAQLQDENGYLCNWTEDEDGSLRIVEHNCAICKIAKIYPQACSEEMAMIRSLTGADVTRVSHIAAGDTTCAYVVKESRG